MNYLTSLYGKQNTRLAQKISSLRRELNKQSQLAAVAEEAMSCFKKLSKKETMLSDAVYKERAGAIYAQMRSRMMGEHGKAEFEVAAIRRKGKFLEEWKSLISRD